jgi:hypothetical protein
MVFFLKQRHKTEKETKLPLCFFAFVLSRRRWEINNREREVAAAAVAAASLVAPTFGSRLLWPGTMPRAYLLAYITWGFADRRKHVGLDN